MSGALTTGDCRGTTLAAPHALFCPAFETGLTIDLHGELGEPEELLVDRDGDVKIDEGLTYTPRINLRSATAGTYQPRVTVRTSRGYLFTAEDG